MFLNTHRLPQHSGQQLLSSLLATTLVAALACLLAKINTEYANCLSQFDNTLSCEEAAEEVK